MSQPRAPDGARVLSGVTTCGPLAPELLDDELDLDVAAGGVGVGADLVGLLY